MIIGTAGHIDHGKTSLVRALTGVDTDRLKEEKARGISIDLGFAYLPAPDGSIIGFIDVPGHEKLVHNMLAGATGIDFVVLVVAADDGVMPQTREHLAIIDLLGIKLGIAVISKSDLVEPQRVVEVTAEVADTIADTGLAGIDILPVSSRRADEVAMLRDVLFREARATAAHKPSGLFRLAVDRSFTLTGIGTVVTGTVLSGQVAVGDQVVVSPSGRAARVRSIHAQNQLAQTGIAGQRCALNLAGDGITKDAIARGDVVLDQRLHAPTDRVDAVVTLLASEQKPLSQWMPVRVHQGSNDVAARLVPLEQELIAPGGRGRVQLVFEQSIAVAVGDRFVLRDTTAQRTIGGGKFIDLRAPARKRRTPERLAQLEVLALDNSDDALNALLQCAPFHADLSIFARDRAIALSEIEAQAAASETILVQATSLGFAKNIWQQLERSVVDSVTAFHRERPEAPGISVAQLRLKVEPRLPPPVFASVVQVHAKAGVVVLDGAGVRLPGHTLQLTPADDALWRKISPRLAAAERFRPPRVRDLAEQLSTPEANVRRTLKVLARAKQVDEVAPDHYFLRTTVAEIVDICADLAAQSSDGYFIAAQLRDKLDNGRKVAIQILEFFDRHGVTMRRGDQRRINLQRRELFATAAQAGNDSGGETSPVGRPDFKSGRGRQTVSGGFDSLSLPPRS